MTVQTRIAAVTGANKGIGLAIVRNLALQYPKSPLKSGPFLIYLTARNSERGAEALKTLANDPQLTEAKVLAEQGGDTTIKFHNLDIANSKSIRSFASFLKNQHPKGIDIVINNAGIALQGYDAEILTQTIDTNYYGTLEATRAFLPNIRDGGRLINITSSLGKLTDRYSDEIRKKFRQAAKTNVEAVNRLMEKAKQAAREGREKETGFPTTAYPISKAGATAMTMAVAREGSRGVLVNACCPGYVKTDLTRGGGVKTPDEGAKTPVMLALEDIGGRTGDFWHRERVEEW
ncbi:NAD(P)-binding protein [Piedraia hortae CBS 480.64]|uniref:NAD(P)-binding protein n=1 Tax=Piedraia hortae CBS 480.64 TaxID=1314780 RepID=A0A6A7BQP5_9PEZI|nr:NAD(P)-binding protein [Piedraia hortae CBS 480.64]